MHALVEGEAVRAADEPDAAGAQERQELRLALPEPPLRVRRKPAVQVRGHVHEDDAVRLLRRLQRAVQEREILLARPCQPRGRVGAAHLDLAGDARLGVQDDEARVAVGEGEVHRPVDAREGLRAARVVQVVVPDHADVRDREPGNEPEVVLVPIRRPRAGEVSELAKNTGGGSSPETWAMSSAKMPSAVGSGQAPESPATTKLNG